MRFLSHTIQGANPDAVRSHPHAKPPFRSGLIMYTLTHASSPLPFPGAPIGARRPRREAADGSRLLLELLFNLFRESRGLRGRRGAQQSSGGEAFSHTSVKTGLVAHSLAARSAIQLPRLPPPPRPLLPWTPTSCQKHVACCCACPCARARSAGRYGIWRMAESSSRGHHVICARTHAGTA